jgi:hypothetical protein
MTKAIVAFQFVAGDTTSSTVGCAAYTCMQLWILIRQQGGASTPASVTIEVTPDGSVYFPIQTFTANTAGDTHLLYEIPEGSAFVRIRWTPAVGPEGSSSSIQAVLTGLSD